MKLRVEDMAIAFENKKILEHVSLQVAEGEFVALIGPSGCGKSTLLNILAGVLQAAEGCFYVDDEKVEGISSHFAYMPQSDLLLPWHTILENVTLYGRLHHAKKQAQQQALKEFATFGLAGYEHAYPKELSGGEQQRVALARALVNNPSILLADEPTGNLDSKTSDDVIGLLKMTSKEFNQTIVMITHNPEIAQMADRIVRIEDGRIVSQ